MASLDKFYTTPEAAALCVDRLSEYLDISKHSFLEPSAGNGIFLDALKNAGATETRGIDIAPERLDIAKEDFFEMVEAYTDVIIGNPPFGKRSALAIDFFNHAAAVNVDVIAFIVPVSFLKWNVQKNLDPNFALVSSTYLPEKSFTDNGKPYSIRTAFQIWMRKPTQYKDLRLQKAPPISHPDFLIWQYNATAQAFSAFDEDWEIALYRQGHYDFNTKFTPADREMLKANSQRQYFFIKPLCDRAREIINKMDFNALAARNTTTPGFGKGDFVSYYTELLNN